MIELLVVVGIIVALASLTAAGLARARRYVRGALLGVQLKSPAFKDGEPLPTKYSSAGADLSPPLDWTDGPDKTKSFVLICYDYDMQPKPFAFWLVWNLPPDRLTLPEGVPRQAELDDPPGTRQGRNSWGANGLGYRAPPAPPNAHHYSFELTALDTMLSLPGGVDEVKLRRAMENHYLSSGSLGALSH